MLRFSAVLAGLIAIAVSCARVSAAEDVAAPSLEMNGVSFGLLVGGNGGSGTLTFEGRTYPFRFWGVTEASVSAATVATGTVHDLRRLEDFRGYYRPTARRVLIGRSVSTTTLRNANGVTIDLVSTVRGPSVGLAWSAIDVDLSGGGDHAYEEAKSQ